jgi:hypothetical protein
LHGLEREPDFLQIVLCPLTCREPGRVSLQCEAQFTHFPKLLEIHLLYSRSRPRLDDDQPIRFKLAQRIANWRATHPDFRRQRVGHERRARTVLSIQNALPDVVVGDIRINVFHSG